MSRARSIKRDESGAWMFVVDLTPPGGTRKQVRRRGYRTKAEAQEGLDVVKGQAKAGTYVEPSRDRVGAYLLRWVDTLPAAGRKPSTVDSYRQYVTRYLVGTPVGDTALQSLGALQLDELFAAMLGRGLSARTVRYLHAIVGKALGDAERKGLVVRNVTRLADPPTSKATRAPEHTIWTPVELRSFLDHVNGHRHDTVVWLAALTGLRRGELCGLRWTDIDLDVGTLRVRQAVSVTQPTVAGKRTTELHVGDAKTARSRRTVDLDAGTVTRLRDHRWAMLEERLKMGAGFTDAGFVFCRPDGSAWNPDTISQAFDRLVASSDLPRVRFHDLRHGHASHMLAAGVNPKVVSDRLGHASVSFTLDVYAHVMPGQQRDAADLVADLIFGAP